MTSLFRLFPKATLLAAGLCLFASPACISQAADSSTPSLELSRVVRPWEFLSAVGTQAGLLGNESGNFEAWVYPLKIFRNLQLQFRVDGHIIPSTALARSVVVRPESSAILYTWDTFTVRETFFVPVHEQGAYVRLDVETSQPLEITASFDRDFQLEWPASFSDSDIDWMPALHAFELSADQQKFEALIGSPSATDHHLEYATNYAASRENSIDLGVTTKGADTKLLVIAAAFDGRLSAEARYRRLTTSYDSLLESSAAYYQSYLARTLNLSLPDKKLEQAYDWSRVAVLQGLVENPYLGTGLIAGYGLSGSDQRPGYAWFFGRDALWTSFALNASGDFTTTRTALDFLSRYQRADGKITHEIAQGASFVPWFKDLPYAYAAADATPLYIITVEDYVRRSGDVGWAKEKWDNIWRAYEFLQSTYNAQGFPRNLNVGHGWVEGGPLLPVQSELYQTSLGVEALHALADLARQSGKTELVADLDRTFHEKQEQMNQAYWLAARHRYAFAIDAKDQPVDTPSVLATVPMWFHLLDGDHANEMLTQLAAPDHQTDWGMRILSSGDPRYDPSGYHFGTVWPLFTGWASVAEYRYHRTFAGYSNLRANALLVLDGSLGHVTEVLSGNYNQGLATASPQQIWSSAMVVSPLVLGMLSLDGDAFEHRVTLAPHLPADWKDFAARNIQAGAGCAVDLQFRRTETSITVEAHNQQSGRCELEFAPALSVRAHVLDAELDGKAVPFHATANANDQHVTVRMPVTHAAGTLVIHTREDFGLSAASELPLPGTASRGMRVTSERWSDDRNALVLDIAGSPAQHYAIDVFHPAQILSVDGAVLDTARADKPQLLVAMPDGPPETPVRSKVTIRFVKRQR